MTTADNVATFRFIVRHIAREQKLHFRQAQQRAPVALRNRIPVQGDLVGSGVDVAVEALHRLRGEQRVTAARVEEPRPRRRFERGVVGDREPDPAAGRDCLDGAPPGSAPADLDPLVTDDGEFGQRPLHAHAPGAGAVPQTVMDQLGDPVGIEGEWAHVSGPGR